uniref:Auxin-responsive protein n=1 Tax=Aegilops tauschii subsp. strangulata TaxID=200361 RepID=A0A453I4W7_AEGTS
MGEDAAQGSPWYVQMSKDGSPYLRKVDLKMYSSHDSLQLLVFDPMVFPCVWTLQLQF